MANAPRFKVYTPDGEYVASCKHAEDAAALVALYGDGATIRAGHSRRDILWHEGFQGQPAAESYDFVARTAEGWLREKQNQIAGRN